MSERRDMRRDHDRKLVSGQIPPEKAAAARSLIEGAGLAIDAADEVSWRVGPFQFWPATGYWTRPGANEHGYGTASLIKAARAASSQTG